MRAREVAASLASHCPPRPGWCTVCKNEQESRRAWKAQIDSLVLVEQPEQGDRGTADNEEKELNVPVLVIGELMNEYLRASNVDESATSETEHN